MSGYVASAKLRSEPRFIAAARRPQPRATRDTTARTADNDWIELVGRPPGARLVDWWSELREQWSQITFFLFDPESWR